jgi:hypothetical protein
VFFLWGMEYSEQQNQHMVNLFCCVFCDF